MYNKEDHEEHDDKDELYTECAQCSCQKLLAYWDDELESYIYLSDVGEPALCSKCMSASELVSEMTFENSREAHLLETTN